MAKTNEHIAPADQNSARNRAFEILVAVLLALSFVGMGFLVVALPDFPTRTLASAYSGTENPATPFTKDELVKAAIAGKQYTFGNHDIHALEAVELEISQDAASAGRTGIHAPKVDSLNENSSHEAISIALSKGSEAYVLDENAISHLDDVWRVAIVAYGVLAALMLLTAFLCFMLNRNHGTQALGCALSLSWKLVVIPAILLLLWAVVDFYSLFAAMHGLFFAEGSWLFSYNSLLITMYPTVFWIGMGAIWLCTTLLLCLIAGITGRKLRGKTTA